MTYDPHAFPSSDDNRGASAEYGMTLRDYFAAKALQGLISATPDDATSLMNATIKAGFNDPKAWFAHQAYKIADAMLAERAE